MVKVSQLIEMVKEDINEEESITLTFFSKMLQKHFRFIILAGIPFLLYVIFSAGKLH